MSRTIKIALYHWAGSWGPFKITVPYGECSLTEAVILDCIETDLQGIEVDFQQFDWLSQWWKPLRSGGYHAPIVLVEGKLVSQGMALNRGLLIQAVTEAAAKIPLKGNHVYFKSTCPHCRQAKDMLSHAGMNTNYYDVIKEPRALYEMLTRVKPIIGTIPVTVPQIWLDGMYIGGVDAVSDFLETNSAARSLHHRKFAEHFLGQLIPN